MFFDFERIRTVKLWISEKNVSATFIEKTLSKQVDPFEDNHLIAKE